MQSIRILSQTDVRKNLYASTMLGCVLSQELLLEGLTLTHTFFKVNMTTDACRVWETGKFPLICPS